MNPIKIGKLVRDRVPECVRKDGWEPVWHTMSHADYVRALKAKLIEECGEYLADPSVEELADILAVIQALASDVHATPGYELASVAANKEINRGGFEGRVFLYTINPPDHQYAVTNMPIAPHEALGPTD